MRALLSDDHAEVVREDTQETQCTEVQLGRVSGTEVMCVQKNKKAREEV